MDSLQAIATSMATDADRLAKVGQNIVNAGTPAYRREAVRVAPFGVHWVDGQSAAPAAAAEREPVDTRPGALRYTGAPLDLALETSNAYFEVLTPQGPAYTRRGDFTLDGQGRLCDHAGHPVMGQAGTVMFSGTAAPTIERDGTIRQGEDVVDRLRVLRFDHPALLERVGGSLYLGGGAAPAPAAEASMRQQHLEASNVDTANEMVALIETLRHFEAGQKVVQALDDMQDRALRKLGEFQ